MDIQRKCFEESNNVNPDWSFKFDEELQQYIALDSEMELQVDEFNEHWDTFRAGWQAAKAQAIPDGFVLVPKEPTEEMLIKGNRLALADKGYRYDATSIWETMLEAARGGNE